MAQGSCGQISFSVYRMGGCADCNPKVSASLVIFSSQHSTVAHIGLIHVVGVRLLLNGRWLNLLANVIIFVA
uniref:Uncharacterized protein n=1 Tax=Anguilla anguilla TaxID=7936 RepID=A0A0E9XRE1_ANGAN